MANNFDFNGKLLINSNGNVLIGTTTDSGFKLNVNGVTYSESVQTAIQGINVSSYGFLTQTISGQMTLLGHNVRSSSSVANQAVVVNADWISSLIKQYYNDGITFHTSSTMYGAGANYPFGDTERMRITPSGNVGIGAANPLTRLEVASSQSNSSIRTGGLEMQSYSINNGWYAENLFFNGGTWQLRDTGYATQMYMQTGTIDFNRTASGAGGSAATLLTTMRLNNNGNVLIGTTTDNGNKLNVNGSIFSAGAVYMNAGYTNDSNYIEKTLGFSFANGEADKAVNISIGNISTWGYIEVEVTGTFSFQNTGGKLTKRFAIGTNPNNNIFINESRVSDSMGTVPANIAIGEFQWDAGSSSYVIPISHITSTGNGYTAIVRAFSHSGGAWTVYNNLSVSAVYSLAALSYQYPYYNSRLGIGTPNPTNMLHVETDEAGDTIQLKLSNRNASGGAGIQIDRNSNVRASQILHTLSGSAGWYQGVLRRGGGANTNFSIGTGEDISSTTPVLHLTTAGNVLIGTTTDNGYKLRVSGQGYFDSVVTMYTGFSSYTTDGLFNANAIYGSVFTPSGNSRIRFGYFDQGGGQYWGRIGFNGSTNWNIGTAAGGESFQIGIGNDSSAALLINNAGQVGIGTTNPVEKLTIDGTASGAYVRISNAASGDISSGFMIYNGNNLDTQIYTNPTFGNTTFLTREDLAIRAGGSQRMAIKSNGNVLIGTTTDSGYKLAVNGTSYIIGAALFGSTIDVNGNVTLTQDTNDLIFQQTNSSSHGIVWKNTSYTKDSASIRPTGNGAWATQGIGFYTGNTGDSTTAPTIRFNIEAGGNITMFGAYNHLKFDNWSDDNNYIQQTKPDGTVVGYYGFNGYSSPSAYYTDYELFTRPNGGSLTRRIFVSNTGAMSLQDASGNVLIGTQTDSGYKLDVNGECIVRDYFRLLNGYAVVLNGSDANWRIGRNTITDSGWLTGNTLQIVVFGGSSGQGFQVVNSNGTALFEIDGVQGYTRITATLGVGVNPSGTTGRIDAANDIVAYSSSDRRLKENIKPIENALDKVKALTGVEFDWKAEHKEAHGYEGHDTGIIAQEVQEVMPTAVRTNDTGYLAVRYEKLIGLLIEANKELAEQVVNQQSQIDELKKLIK